MIYDTFDAADEAANEWVASVGGTFERRRDALVDFAETRCTPDVGVRIRRAWLGETRE